MCAHLFKSSSSLNITQDGAHRDSLNCDQMIMVDSKKLPALMVTDDGPKTNDSSLLVRMEIDPRDSQEWTHRTRDGGRHVFPPKEVCTDTAVITALHATQTGASSFLKIKECVK